MTTSPDGPSTRSLSDRTGNARNEVGSDVQRQPAGSVEIARTSLTEEAASRLRALIAEQYLLPGTKLKEKDLCARFGVSRTPLREAFKVLASEGLIEILPNRGAQVARVSVEETREVFEVLAALERLSGELAASQATDEDIAEMRALHYTMVLHFKRGERDPYFRLNQAIHAKIVETARNGVLSQLHATLNSRVRWARFSANLPSDRWAAAVREHEAILAAFEARDGQALAVILRDHLMSKFHAIKHAIPTD